jgi:hypothetical protein
LLFACSAHGWAQPLATSSTTLPPVASESSSSDTSWLNEDGTINWPLLVRASATLSTEAEALQQELQTLQTQYDSLLRLSKDADDAAHAVIAAQSRQLWLWRGVAAVAVASTVYVALRRH